MTYKDKINNLIPQLIEKGSRYKVLSHILVGLLIGVFISYLYSINLLNRVELMSLDLRFKARPPISRTNKIIHVDMSEHCIESIGRWPWPRKWQAALTSILSEFNPKMIIYDVVFSEPGLEENDVAFGEAIKKCGNVYLGLMYNTVSLNYNDLIVGKGIKSVLRPIPILKQSAKGVGHLNVIPDPDGVIRAIPPLIDYKGSKSYHISLKGSFDYLDIDENSVEIDAKNHFLICENNKKEKKIIPLNQKNQVIVNWVDKWGRAFKHYSFFDVIKSFASYKKGEKAVVNLEDFENKIVVIGLTASALIDIKPTPIQSAYPAVGAIAAIMNSFINDSFVTIPDKKHEIALICLISIFVSMLLFKVRPINGMILTGVMIFFYIFCVILIFNRYAIWINLVYPVTSILLSYVLITLYTQVAATVERNKLFREATRDGLTNLYNIRHFNLLLDAEFRNLKLKKAKAASIIMSDIDNFKKINDTYGHQVGDVILRDIAKIFQVNCRQIDVVARYGGEEFIILLPGAFVKDAIDVAERIRQNVETKKFKFKDKHYTATISFGVGEYKDEASKEDFIRKTDEALYRAKTTGKNKVVAG